ncbi:MAG TPA: dihydroxy-acid dehydratase [Gaiellaceae bacterium]|jgi:dihydroxy-acid dehydratase|nr:dihydroxy-acid dehydratase [Gaiellaceae bacterium]
MTGLRSERWFGPSDISGLLHRSVLRTSGVAGESAGRPLVGICNCWSDLVNCNLHFRAIAESVRRGVLTAGGIPAEFPAISVGETLMKPTSMMYRNLMSMDVEESLRAYPFDAVVLIASCDKTIPAQLMGAASADLPAIMITGGPAEPGRYKGKRLSTATDLWRYADEFRAGRMSEDEMSELEASLQPSVGHCNEMGTASSLSAVVEALGMSLPGSSTVPATHGRRLALGELCGARAVELAREGTRISSILTRAAFENAITTLMALGGSTNGVVHLIALAGRLGIELTLDDFARISARTPVLANMKPTGEHLFQDLHDAGGVPALLAEIESLLDTSVLTVTGATLAEELAGAERIGDDPIRPLGNPLKPAAIGVVRGSLAPRGAIVKLSAASPELMRHRGPALVFEDISDLAARIDDPDLPATADTVLVLRNAGPIGGPGMPEWGALPIPAKLIREGVTDMVRVSDARMSGTAFGTAVLHVSPESAAGGPLAAVQNGDPIVLDCEAGLLELDIPEAELASRLETLPGRPARYERGYRALYEAHVLQADQGCDFDFLRPSPGAPAEDDLPTGILEGWIGGW